MRLLNLLVEHLPDVALWLHPPQGLKRQLATVADCSTLTTVTLPVQTAINSLTVTYGRRDVGSVCTTTVSVNLTTVTSLNSLTSTYTGPPSSPVGSGGSVCTTTVSTNLTPVTSLNNLTTYTRPSSSPVGSGGSVCTTTVSVDLAPVTTIYNLTSSYNGPLVSQSSAPVRQFLTSLMFKTVLSELGVEDNESTIFLQLRIKHTGRTPSIKMLMSQMPHEVDPQTPSCKFSVTVTACLVHRYVPYCSCSSRSRTCKTL
jgi:hypothetical protein